MTVMAHNIISYWPLWLFCILPSVYGFLHRVLLHIRSLYLVFIIVSSFVVELPLLTKRNELSQCKSSAAQPAGITPQSRHLCWLPSSLEDGPGFCSFGCSCVAPTPTYCRTFRKLWNRLYKISSWFSFGSSGASEMCVLTWGSWSLSVDS